MLMLLSFSYIVTAILIETVVPVDLIPAVKNGFQTESSFTNYFSSAQLTFYEEKSMKNENYIRYSEEANTV